MFAHMPAAIVPRLFLARLYHFLTFWLLLSSNLAKAIKLDIQSGRKMRHLSSRLNSD